MSRQAVRCKGALFVVAFFGAMAGASAEQIEPPGAGLPAASRVSQMGSVALPIGPFREGAVPTQPFEGLVQESAWQIPENGLTTLEIMAPMRATLAQGGFDLLFECEAFTCGGFDFRYALALLPEPEMHVDLADYRYLSAARGKEGLGLIVSRSASTAFVQVTFVGRALDVALSSDPVPPASAQATIPLRRPIEADPSDLATHLTQNGSAILTGLEFSAGSGVLSGANQQVIAALAEWMTQNPGLRIALVGHTDASGALEGNLTLSRQRAEAVRSVLVEQHGLDPQRIEAQGVGYLAPLASNLTEEGRRQNRRVEVMVTSTQASQ